MGVQTDFSQPMVLVNETPLFPLFQTWDEQLFWDDLALHQQNLNVEH
jgi:hypothetical protein